MDMTFQHIFPIISKPFEVDAFTLYPDYHYELQSLLGMIEYNESKPDFNCQYQLLIIIMSFYDSLWNISVDEPSYNYFDGYMDPQRLPFHDSFLENLNPLNINEECIDNPHQMPLPLTVTSSEQKQTPIVCNLIQNNQKTNTESEIDDEESTRRKKIKASPYHNFQKHLNTAIRHIVTFPIVQLDSPNIVLIAQRLWKIFLSSKNSTKKILSFIFNQFNQYPIKPADLKKFGFEEAYALCGKEQLAEAKTFLTRLAIDQMNEENVNDYLETRRITNPQKFKNYLSVFRQELEDGFLKKRFTNKNRKLKIMKELKKNCK